MEPWGDTLPFLVQARRSLHCASPPLQRHAWRYVDGRPPPRQPGVAWAPRATQDAIAGRPTRELRGPSQRCEPMPSGGAASRYPLDFTPPPSISPVPTPRLSSDPLCRPKKSGQQSGQPHRREISLLGALLAGKTRYHAGSLLACQPACVRVDRMKVPRCSVTCDSPAETQKTTPSCHGGGCV